MVLNIAFVRIDLVYYRFHLPQTFLYDILRFTNMVRWLCIFIFCPVQYSGVNVSRLNSSKYPIFTNPTMKADP